MDKEHVKPKNVAKGTPFVKYLLDQRKFRD